MRRTSTSIRCVPRFGYDFAQVRSVDLDLPDQWDDDDLRGTLDAWFRMRGIAGAIYDVDADDNGFFAIVNDEAYHVRWGEPVL